MHRSNLRAEIIRDSTRRRDGGLVSDIIVGTKGFKWQRCLGMLADQDI